MGTPGIMGTKSKLIHGDESAKEKSKAKMRPETSTKANRQQKCSGSGGKKTQNDHEKIELKPNGCTVTKGRQEKMRCGSKMGTGKWGRNIVQKVRPRVRCTCRRKMEKYPGENNITCA